MLSGKELRYQILKYLLGKEHSGEASLAEENEIATDLSVTTQDIIDQIDILESVRRQQLRHNLLMDTLAR